MNEKVKTWLTSGCVYFSALSIAVILIYWAMAGQIENTVLYVSSFLRLVPISLILAFAQWSFRLKIAPALRFLLHFCGVLSSLFLFFVGSGTEASRILILAAILSLIYWIVAFILLMVGKN